ncbi:hypothetical protein T11_305 [Trichinella zimbabwensis]|uniref:Uncharacterized protein n=1 Tax=Trichinella zimbabwensis TaxID=268475 RepID=A0A0V1GSM1_9BILA|nr:hypothetical protein T11_5611 [Trichinella zimbabwensis]KRZ01553.1 hypothetical protein T11_305 [Trichinella zimbabwensis]
MCYFCIEHKRAATANNKILTPLRLATLYKDGTGTMAAILNVSKNTTTYGGYRTDSMKIEPPTAHYNSDPKTTPDLIIMVQSQSLTRPI